MSASGPDGPRLQPLPKEEWGDDVRAAFEMAFPDVAPRFLSEGPDAMRAPNGLTTLMHHPALAGPFLAYNAVLLFAPALDPRTREIVVLRVAWRTRSEYEWVQHTRLADGVGLSADEIEAVGRGAGDDTWTPHEADLLAATDQLLDGYRVDDATWARLAAHLDERQMVELVFVVGTYACLAMAFKSFGLELDPDLASVDAIPLPE